jgi:hypothetical protein
MKIRLQLAALFSILLLTHMSFSQKSSSDGTLTIYPIQYTNGVDYLVKKDFYGAGNYSIRYNEKGNASQQTLNMTNGEVLLTNLKSNTIYQISLYKDNEPIFSNPLEIDATINDEIYVASKLNELLEAYSTKKDQQISIFDYLNTHVSNQNLNAYEVISVLQQFFMKNELGLKRGSFEFVLQQIKNYASNGEKTECTCKFVLNHNRDFNPHNVAASENSPNNTIVPISGVDIFSGNNQNRMFTHSTKGPAHSYRVLAEGSSGQNQWQFMTQPANGFNSGSGSPHYAAISYHLMCLGSKHIPKECGCEKRILVSYRADARQRTTTTNFPLFIFSHGSEISLDDMAVVFARSATGQVTILDAGRGLTYNKCNKNVNPDFFLAAGDLAVSIMQFIQPILAISGENGDSTNVIETLTPQISGLVQNLVAFASQPYFNVSGNCTDTQAQTTLVAGENTLVLKANVPLKLILTSFCHIKYRGYGRWLMSGESYTDYALTAFVPPSSYYINDSGLAEDASWCCTDKLFSYISGAYDGLSPLNTANVRQFIASNLGLFSPWNDITYNNQDLPIITQDHGRYIYYSSDQDCAETIPRRPSGNTFTTNNVHVYPNPAKDVLNIELINANLKNVKIKILGSDGKLLYSSPEIESNTQFWKIDLNNLNLVSGMYLVQVTNDNQIVETIKFIKQ